MGIILIVSEKNHFSSGIALAILLNDPFSTNNAIYCQKICFFFWLTKASDFIEYFIVLNSI